LSFEEEKYTTDTMFIDTHSHLYLGELQNHISEAIQHLRENNFSHTIQIGTSIETSRTCIELAKKYDIVRATVGIHPCEAQDIPVEKIPEQIHLLEQMIQGE
jgi:TatD DNase family protein